MYTGRRKVIPLAELLLHWECPKCPEEDRQDEATVPELNATGAPWCQDCGNRMILRDFATIPE